MLTEVLAVRFSTLIFCLESLVAAFEYSNTGLWKWSEKHLVELLIRLGREVQMF